MKSKSAAFIRGKRMRATRTDASGRPVIGDNNSAVSKGFVSAAYATNSEEGEAIVGTNANGETCVNEPATPTLNGFGVELVFCDVDFSMFTLITGQDVVADEDGVIVGITESTDVSVADVHFALEIWTGATAKGVASAGSQGSFGYVLTPFLSGGLVSDVTIENAAINFTVSGMATKNGSNWGSGPYAVELSKAGVATALRTPMLLNDHRRIQIVEVAPPGDFAGSLPVLDPTDPPITAVTETATGLSVAFTLTPTGQPAFYDFGDGQWDYSPTGGYTHVYDAAGTYTVKVTSGLTTISKTIVVSAA